MPKFARMTASDSSGDRVAIEVVSASNAAEISSRYHPVIAEQFIQVPADTVQGSVKNGSTWTHPEPVPEPATPEPALRTRLTRPEFKLQFTSAERIAIRQAREYDGDDAAASLRAAIIDDFFDIINDPALSYVDLELPATIEGVNYLESEGLIATGRATEILTGVTS